ncbi:MAG: CDP-diacylglycerol--serine O-phosphatidyltransferase [Gemmataceae bacterium]|nr:CDP-diacylglycerol--serine O-phosphatidyltransferase [Gemmataceae bacterium]
MRKIAVVPTLLTLSNGVCGFVAIAIASKITLPEAGVVVAPETARQFDFYFAIAGWFIIAAMVFDMLDGYVARLSKTASKFGGELDSLCDAISFGVAPAFLLLKMGPGWEPHPGLHQILAGIAALYMVCTILRLARFNVDNTPDPDSHKRFRGLPSPGAAGCIASLAVLRGEFPSKLAERWGHFDLETARELVQRAVEWISPIGGFVVALLMVTLLPYPHVAKQILRGRRHVWHVILVMLAAFVVILMRELALAVIFWGYALGLPLAHLFSRHVLKEDAAAPRLEDGLQH